MYFGFVVYLGTLIIVAINVIFTKTKKMDLGLLLYFNCSTSLLVYLCFSMPIICSHYISKLWYYKRCMDYSF